MTLQERVVGERAESLAIVLLTRHPDLSVVRQEAVVGIDLLVKLSSDGQVTGRVFGVEVKSTVKPISSVKDNWIVSSAHTEIYRDLPFPLCMFFFTMQDNKAYWKWVRKPVSVSGDSQLVFDTSITFEPLDDEAIQKIVSAVNEWYSHLYTSSPTP